MIIISQITRVYEAVRTHFENAAAARDLHRMSDYQLRDLGIERDQIETLVYGADKAAEARRQYKRPAFGYAQLS